MKRLSKYLIIILLSTSLAACSAEDSLVTNTDNYDEVRKAAWEYLKEKDWHETTENWQSAEVEKVVADKNYELLEENYLGAETLKVSFEDVENASVSTPIIIIDIHSNKVIGYMLME